MSRFLVTCWPFVGHLYPQMSVALALRERGHEVAFYTHRSGREIVEAEGFEFFPFVEVNEQRYERIHALEAEVPATQPTYQTVSVAMKAYRDMLADSIPEQVADLQPVLRNWRPDVVITDPALWGPILVLWEVTGIPVVLLTQMIGSMIPGPDAPPWGPGLRPPRTFGTRMLARGTQLAIDIVAHNMRRQVNLIRARYGLGPMNGSVNAHTGKLPLYLIPSVPELDYDRRDQPPNVHYVGPCVWTRPRAATPPEWFERLPSGRPCVHATEGTAHYQEPFLLRAAATGLGGEALDVILTTGNNRDASMLGLDAMAPNVRVERWLSHEELLPKCAALITTGGAATVLVSLKFGVPLLVVPTFWDKNDNAQRVVEAGAGLRIAPKSCTPERLRNAVKRLIEESHFRESAQRLARLFAAAQGPPRAARLLEDLAVRRPNSSPLRELPYEAKNGARAEGQQRASH